MDRTPPRPRLRIRREPRPPHRRQRRRLQVIDAFLFRPFPVLEPERLVEVQSRTVETELGGVSAPDYFDFVELGADRFPLAARMGFVLNVRVADVTERIEGAFVSSSYFDVLGVPPAIGRGVPVSRSRRTFSATRSG